MQHFLHRRFGFIDVSDEAKSVFTRKIPCYARLFRDHWSPQRKERSRPIAYPAGLPGYIDALNGRKLRKCARHVSTIRTRSTRHKVRISTVPAELFQALPFRIVRADIHR